MLQSLILPHQIQHEVAALCHVPDDGGKDSARSCRSIWKPSHGYNDLLYRVSESAIVLSSPDGEVVGEVVVELRKIFRQFLLLIKVCILCVLSLTAFWVSVAVVENSFKRVTLFFDSILGVFRGDWETPFTVLCGGCLTRQFYVVAK